MNNTLEMLHNTSIISFTYQPLTQAQRDAIFKAVESKGLEGHIEDYLERSKPLFMLEYLYKQGFAKK